MKAAFSHHRFRWITPDAALVDADLSIRNMLAPNGKNVPLASVRCVGRHESAVDGDRGGIIKSVIPPEVERLELVGRTEELRNG